MSRIRVFDPTAGRTLSEVDAASIYARPKWHPMRWIFVKRLELMMELFDDLEPPERLLEIGLGSGVLIPELAARAGRYIGIDIHDSLDLVKAQSDGLGQGIDLLRADVRALPFAGDSFDLIFALSVLEHMDSLDSAIDEIGRVLQPGGRLLVGFPIENVFSNALLDLVKLMTDFDRKLHHLANHSQIRSSLSRNMRPLRERAYPVTGSLRWSLFYTGAWIK